LPVCRSVATVPASPSAPPTSGAPRTDAEVPAYWRSLGLPGLADERCPRVHLDTTMAGTDFSNQFAALPPSYVERLGGLGDRVVLGSDFPNIPHPYVHQVEALHRLGLGDEWMRKVLWHNGARLLRLENGDG